MINTVFSIIFFNICLLVSCELKSSNNNHRVIHGYPAYSGQFSHQALIFVKDYNKEIEICAGSVLARRWILTCASCVHLGVFFQIQLGSIYFNRWDQQLFTKTVYVHELFQGGNSEYNIALLKLFSDIIYNPKVLPILLPTKAPDKTIDNSQPHLVSGFGGLGPIDNLTLQYADVKILPESVCVTYFPTVGNQHFLCSLGKDNIYQSPCFGDSGAPLVSIKPNNEYILIGIYAVMLSGGCDVGQPAGYINVFRFKSWIYHITNGLA